MAKEQANEEGKKVAEKYERKRKVIEKKAKEEGIWIYGGLDSNEYLFKEARKELYDEFNKNGSIKIDTEGIDDGLKKNRRLL